MTFTSSPTQLSVLWEINSHVAEYCFARCIFLVISSHLQKKSKTKIYRKVKVKIKEGPQKPSGY